MARKTRISLAVQLDVDGKPLAGVGPGAGRAFTQAYFPEAHHIIRIASAYFTLTGYKQGRKYIRPSVQFEVLVGREEGQNVKATVIDEILADLGQCEMNLWDTVFDLVERMKSGQFIIRDAREMETPFHCKFYICDDRVMWHGSANYTGSGLNKNAEQVTVSHDRHQITQFTQWYDEIAQDARDLMIELIARLQAWLDLAAPFDVYLKTLLLLNNLPDYASRPGAHLPVYYQKGVIARGLRQAAEFGGAFIVVATGLGKTVIGAEIAWRLLVERKIKRVILIAPNGVHTHWKDQLESRDVYATFFNIDILFRQASTKSYHQATQLEALLRQQDHETVIIIDEAHFYRNQLLLEKSKGRKSLVYQRLIPVVQQGAKIFLLTATAYGTNFQNLNSLLYLLPHQGPSLIDIRSPWEAHSADQFATLPVVTTLGLPHVLKMARDRGDVDRDGRTFIQFAHERRYLPKTLKLNSIRYRLSMQSALQALFDQHCFDLASRFPQLWFDDTTMKIQSSTTDTIYNTSLLSWLSSPIAMADSLELNLATPGKHDEHSLIADPATVLQGATSAQQLSLWAASTTNDSAQPPDTSTAVPPQGRRYDTRLSIDLDHRRTMIEPLLPRLKQHSEDDKFAKLKEIITERYLGDHSKVIIFVGRHLTALYLVSKLEDVFGKQINIGCTVEPSDVAPRLKASPYRSEVLKQFSPRSHNYQGDREYNILVCTDADGVGVNLQDADTIINYDPPDGADVLFQRAGRVLRMTTDPQRIVHFYTLVPSIVDEVDRGSRVQNDIREIFDRITHRHHKSKRILGSDVLSEQGAIEVTLDSDLDVEQLTRDSEFLEDIGGVGAESIISHTAVLEQHRDRAMQLPEYLLSARTYKQSKHRVFILLQDNTDYHPLMFNVSTKKFETRSDLDMLDIIACSTEEPRAMINPADIERIINRAVQIWCDQRLIPIDQVRKICALYLVPTDEVESIASILHDLRAEEAEQEV